jgi:hypothetical protein
MEEVELESVLFGLLCELGGSADGQVLSGHT